MPIVCNSLSRLRREGADCFEILTQIKIYMSLETTNTIPLVSNEGYKKIP